MEIHPLTVIAYSFSSIPIAIGLTSTNKVEGIVKAIIGLFITILPYIYLYFFQDSFNWTLGGPEKEGKQNSFYYMYYSIIYTLIAYISVIIMMLKTTN